MLNPFQKNIFFYEPSFSSKTQPRAILFHQVGKILFLNTTIMLLFTFKTLSNTKSGRRATEFIFTKSTSGVGI